VYMAPSHKLLTVLLNVFKRFLSRFLILT